MYSNLFAVVPGDQFRMNMLSGLTGLAYLSPHSISPLTYGEFSYLFKGSRK